MDGEVYIPAPKVLEGLHKSGFVAVVGPTAVGKTTLIKAAIEIDPQLHMVVSGTSRSPRAGELNGVDFHFDTLESMQERAKRGEYVTAVTHPTGDLYTTAVEDYPPGKIALLAALASALPTFRALPFRMFRTVYVVPPSRETWHERLRGHDFTTKQLERRLKEAEVSLDYAAHDPNVRFVINDDRGRATEDLITLALGEPLSERLQADQVRAKTIARHLLGKPAF